MRGLPFVFGETPKQVLLQDPDEMKHNDYASFHLGLAKVLMLKLMDKKNIHVSNFKLKTFVYLDL